MKRIELKIYDEALENYSQIVELGYSDCGINLQITLDNRNLMEILNDKKLFIKCKEISIEGAKQVGCQYDDIEQDFNYIIDNFEQLIEKVDFVNIISEKGIKKFLDEYPILKTKKIIIENWLTISDANKLEKYINEYEGLDIYIRLEGNMQCISLKSCKETMNYIKQISDNIKKLDLSPFETIIYTYDLVRDRIYQEENENEHGSKSRDLTEIINGSAIVCTGYAELFRAILNYVGINTQITNLKKKNEDSVGHTRNSIKINDPKYGIDGFYYFDTTWDSKNAEGNNDFLYSYLCFAKTRDEMEALEGYKYIYEASPMYSNNMVEAFEKAFNDFEIYEIGKYVKTFNYISDATNSKNYLDLCVFFSNKADMNDIKNKLENMIAKFNKPISAETFIKAINNVRKKQYYISPEKYSYTLDTLYSIYRHSNFKLKNHHYNPTEKLLMMILGEEESKNHDPKKDFENFIFYDFEELKEPKQVQLTKTLSKVLEKKQRSK